MLSFWTYIRQLLTPNNVLHQHSFIIQLFILFLVWNIIWGDQYKPYRGCSISLLPFYLQYRHKICKGKVFNLQEPPSGEFILYHRMLGKLLTTYSNQLKQPIGELLVAVDHSPLRILASETVDPIDWSHSPSSWAVPS